MGGGTGRACLGGRCGGIAPGAARREQAERDQRGGAGNDRPGRSPCRAPGQAQCHEVTIAAGRRHARESSGLEAEVHGPCLARATVQQMAQDHRPGMSAIRPFAGFPAIPQCAQANDTAAGHDLPPPVRSDCLRRCRTGPGYGRTAESRLRTDIRAAASTSDVWAGPPCRVHTGIRTGGCYPGSAQLASSVARSAAVPAIAGRNRLDVHPHHSQSGGADVRRRRQRRRGRLDPGDAARRPRTRHILPDRQLRPRRIRIDPRGTTPSVSPFSRPPVRPGRWQPPRGCRGDANDGRVGHAVTNGVVNHSGTKAGRGLDLHHRRQHPADHADIVLLKGHAPPGAAAGVVAGRWRRRRSAARAPNAGGQHQHRRSGTRLQSAPGRVVGPAAARARF